MWTTELAGKQHQKCRQQDMDAADGQICSGPERGGVKWECTQPAHGALRKELFPSSAGLETRDKDLFFDLQFAGGEAC